jgi:hypothetical protein
MNWVDLSSAMRRIIRTSSRRAGLGSGKQIGVVPHDLRCRIFRDQRP